MERNIAQLAKNTYDLLIIGGGIYGVTTAWDAAQRGLSVALVEKDDFASNTTANSLKIIHGGLRYLQSLDIKRMRESIQERKVMMRIAPHLVHPLKCIMPTYGHLVKGREIMGIGMLLNDIISFDRNWGMVEQKHLPRGRTLNRTETLQLLPGYTHPKFTGATVWYDAQMYNSERLALAFLHSAAEVGAQVANYIKVVNLLLQGNRVIGARVKDLIDGEEFDLKANLVINNGGPFVDSIIGFLGPKRSRQLEFIPSTAINLITRNVITEVAAGLRGKFEFPEKNGSITHGFRVYFVAPWRGYSLVGTQHRPYLGNIEDFRVTEAHIAELLEGINDAYPAAKLTMDDVRFVMAGFLSMDKRRKPGADVLLKKHYSIIDHKKSDGIDGLVTVVGVKYTTARDVSEKTINMAYNKLGKKLIPSQTQELPIHGGLISDFADYLKTEVSRQPFNLDRRTVEHLIYNYGSAYTQVTKYIEEDSGNAEKISVDLPIIRAEIIFSLREEMALHLSDILLRRTDIGTVGYPGTTVVQYVAAIAAKELGWDHNKIQKEIEDFKKIYSPLV